MEHKLTPLQSKLLELLKWFDWFCKEHNLRYYALGGTMLGAMRHHGFIPWDDDIDVGMPRKDFERLKQYAQMNSRYKFETYDSDADDYCYAYNKLYDTTTTLVEHKRIDIVRGVFIDIFPLDGIGDTIEVGIENYRKFKKYYQLYEAMVDGVRKGRAWYKNAAVFFSAFIPKSIYSHRTLSIKMNKICSKYDFYTSKYGGNFFGTYWEREIIDLSYFGNPKYYQFEDMMIAGPEKAEDYLRSIYRDWQKLPPLEKQVSHHDFVMLDLEKGYLN